VDLVVGLGNPGARYAGTRHNVGFEVVDSLLERATTASERGDPEWWAAECELAGAARVLLKPLTFMNRSGPAVARAVGRFGSGTERLVVVVDDVALPPGRLRVRARGSHGGHNGLRSIIEALGTEEFPRVRIGVGAGPPGEDLADHVLSKFPARDILPVRRATQRAAEAVLAVLCEGVGPAMNRFNAVEDAPEPEEAGARD